ncbi:sensor histidine kinase [Clostridium oryzae]|uniref:histidine kinase n=1 Tax=Clostridium oryzae TaxID=1450648 RepID=A0A1V4ILP4_9CLOT|nr:HAMP domain-containing sensor histidine kinase [Clostridium oryzae]OPJ60740.1 signal transduction histidine-protein kinase BaeS [Clostridium oryzae]
MKRIKSLRIELVIFIFAALIISVILALLINSIVKNDFGIGRKDDKQTYEYVYKNKINILVNSLHRIKNYNEEKAEDTIKRFWEDSYTIYLVDRKGRVITGTNSSTLKIDPQYIKNGYKSVSRLSDKNGILQNDRRYYANVEGCYYIQNGQYLFFNYAGGVEDDNKAFLYLLILFPLIYVLLISGRLRYLISINKSVRIIAEGDLTYKVPIKYKNELTRLAQDVNYMVSELQTEEDKRKEFLTNISHDLRTPLTTIIGYINMIQERKYETEAELYEYISIMNRKGSYLKTMLDDFFDYSKLSSKDIEFNVEVIYIQELVRQIIEEEASFFKKGDLELIAALDDNPINISGDGELLYRAINNLLSNALKYSKKRTTVEVNVNQRIIHKKSYGVIAVSSVPLQKVSEAEAAKFFKRLYKQDKSRKQNGKKVGSGLGLSITQEILKLHNGKAEVKIQGQRIIFELILPKDTANNISIQ